MEAFCHQKCITVMSCFLITVLRHCYVISLNSYCTIRVIYNQCSWIVLYNCHVTILDAIRIMLKVCCAVEEFALIMLWRRKEWFKLRPLTVLMLCNSICQKCFLKEYRDANGFGYTNRDAGNIGYTLNFGFGRYWLVFMQIYRCERWYSILPSAPPPFYCNPRYVG